MKPRHILVFAALATVTLISGCMTAAEIRAERISNNQALFMTLDADARTRGTQGQSARGDTTTAVWLALGDPGKRTSDITAQSSVEIWQYFGSVPEEYQVLVPDPPPPHMPPPPPGIPVPAHYETRTRYVSVVNLQIQFDKGRVSRIQQF